MTTAVIIGAILLIGIGLVASQLFRLRDWLNRQPPDRPAPTDEPDPPAGGDDPETPGSG